MTAQQQRLHREAEKARRWLSSGTREADSWLADYVHGAVDTTSEQELASHLGVSPTGLRWGAGRALTNGA